MNEKMVRSHPFFDSMKPEHMKVILECASEIKVNGGEVLFRAGEPANQLYLIQSGSVRLEHHETAEGTGPVQDLGVGEVFGWSWMFPPFVWHLDARALEPSTLMVVSGGHLLVAAERDPAFGYELVKRVTQIVIQRLQATRKRLHALELEGAMEG